MPAISEKIVAGLPAPAEGNRLHYFSGAICQGKKAPNGFAVRTTAAGTKSFVLFHRVAGKPYLPTLGRWVGNEGGGTLTVRDAIIAASDLAKAMATGKQQDPRPARTRRQQDGDADKGLTVAGLLDTFVARYVRKEAKLRTADEIAKTLDRLVKPAIGRLGIYEIKRSHVSKMLAAIADESGPAMADRVLAHVRKAFGWYAVNGHDDDFTSPVVKGMGPGQGDPRDRVLSDDELRDIFTALKSAAVPGCYPRFVKMLLLTATRRNEAAKMHTREIDGDVWTIPAIRYKRLPKHAGLDHVIPLSASALALIGDHADGGEYVFSTSNGRIALGGFSKAKAELDKAIAALREREGRAPMPNFRLHDLRRTARTLMSRAGVHEDHAERALGHIIGGIRGVYDQYKFLDEKRVAFEALAGLVSRILNPDDVVVNFRPIAVAIPNGAR